MPTAPRKQSESNIYHIMDRGVGHCLIFEDADDRIRFLEILDDAIGKYDAALYAWCLMGNHYHLVVKVAYENLSSMMGKLNSSYALYYCARYGREGSLFEERFKSEPIESDEYFLTVIRYVHQNPMKAGISPSCDYRWSSYREYLGADPCRIDRDFALALLDGVEGFEAFHEVFDAAASCIDVGRGETRRFFSDEEALGIARSILSVDSPSVVSSYGKERRDEAIRMLKDAKLSIRQIVRLTGVSQGVVSRIKAVR